MIYFIIAVVAVIGVLGMQNWYLSARVDGLKAKVAMYHEVEQENRHKIDEQNKAVADMLSHAAENVEASRKALAAAAVKAAELERREKELRDRKGTGDPCADTSSALRSPL